MEKQEIPCERACHAPDAVATDTGGSIIHDTAWHYCCEELPPDRTKVYAVGNTGKYPNGIWLLHNGYWYRDDTDATWFERPDAPFYAFHKWKYLAKPPASPDSVCDCPACRYGRGELTDTEYAWYLKGLVGERDDDAPTRLRELVQDMRRRGQPVDRAFLMDITDNRRPTP